MTRFLAISALIFAATASNAGSYTAPADPPVMPPEIIEKQAADSSAPSAGLVLGLMTIVVFGASVAN